MKTLITQEVKRGSVTSDGVLFHYKLIESQLSESITTVLLGGVLQDMDSWKNYVAEFSKTNNVLIVDLPGIGTGGVLSGEKDFSFLAECLNKVLLQLGLNKVNIFSTSYSTIIAFEFAKKYHHKINRLAISSSMTSIPDEQMNIMIDCIENIESEDLSQFCDTFINGITNSHNPAKNKDLAKRVISSGIQKMTSLQKAQFIENTKRVINYRLGINTQIPITPLIFTGELDNFTPPHLCKKVGDYFQRFDFRTIPELDHLFHIGNNTMVFAALIPYFNQGIIPDFSNESVKTDYNLLPAA